MKVGVSYFADRNNRKFAQDIEKILNRNSHETQLIDLVVDKEEEANNRYDLMIVIGGDGAFFNAASYFTFNKLFGISPRISKAARCSAKFSDAEEIIKKLESKEYIVQEESRLEVYLNDDFLDLAINDAVITGPRTGNFFVGNLKYSDLSYDIHGNGVIVYTPLGYEGYAVNLRGADKGHGVLPKDAKAFGIEPFALSERDREEVFSNPFIPNGEELEISIKKKSLRRINAEVGYISIDGEKLERLLYTGDKINIRHRDYMEVIHFNK